MKYFLFNHVGSLNHGCEAIVRGTMNIIENIDPGAEFLLSSFKPETDGIIGGVETALFAAKPLTKTQELISALNVKLKHSEDYALRKMYSDVVEQAKDCDVCLSIGGDTYCYGSNREIQVLTCELKKLGKKTVLWGASIGEEDLTDEKLESLADFDAIFAREPLTYELLKSKNANEKIYLNADPAFCMEREDVKPIDGFDRENTLGLNVSPLVGNYNLKIAGAVRDFIKYVFENTTLKILLVPHVVEQGNNDYEYMLGFYNEFKSTGRMKILPPDLNAKQYKGYIAKTRFFVGARTHSTIAAYSSGVPTAVLGYSVKSRGISRQLFGDGKYVINSRSLDSSAELEKALNSLIENEAEIRKTLMVKIPLTLRSAMQAGETLAEI